MPVKEIECQSILRRFTAPDLYFQGMYGVDVYQNCAFACRYCDSSYDPLVYVYRNAIEVLKEEIKRVPVGRVIIGSVHDPYQPAEASYKLVRQVISTLSSNGFSVHVLTKSPLVLRDLELLSQSRDSMVTVSMISLDTGVNKVFEPDVPSVDERLNTVQMLVDSGVSAGVAVFPVLPFLVDNELQAIIQKAKQYDAEYVVYKHLELKGRQKQDYFAIINKYYPTYFDKYQELYRNRYSPSEQYIKRLARKMSDLCTSMNISCGIPLKI